MDDASLLKHLAECKSSGEQYRDKFKPTWEEIENQIRCVPPESWALKEDWQTKIYIPLQAKKSEIAKSYLKKMIFPKKRFFDIVGVEKEDSDDAFQLANLVEILMQSGGFGLQNDFVVQEGIDIGTSFIKFIMKEDGTGLDFVWRSSYHCLFDPECGHDLSLARFFIDPYNRDLRYVIAKAKKDKFGYDKKIVQQFLDDAALEGAQLQTVENNKEPMMTVKSIDGTQDMTIPAKYRNVDVDEHWVEVPNDKNVYEKRRVVVLNGKYILSNEENVFGFIPAQWCRVKPRKYDSYGLGYIQNTLGLQELMNSCINVGFDSLKISSMDIIVIDDNKVKDPSTIKYKPLAVWKMKDINAVKIQRQPVSAISDVLRGLTMIDQIDQDASGITRQLQSAPTLGGSGGGTETNTLGEYNARLQLLDQRFLDVGRFIEEDYLTPLIMKIVRVILNPKLFSQAAANRLLGMREVADIKVLNGIADTSGTKMIPKLDLEKIRKKGESAYDYKPVGVTQFSGKIETLNKLKEALMIALKTPALASLTKIDKLWKKLWQASEIDDYEEFIKSPEEIKDEMLQQAAPAGPAAPQGPPMMPGQGGGAPMIPPMGGI